MDRADIETSVCDSSREKEDQTKDIAILNHPIKHDKNMAETSPTLRRRKNTHHNSSESDPFTVPQENHVVQDHDSGNSHARTVNEVKKVAESEQQSQKDCHQRITGVIPCCHNEHVELAHSESSTNYAYQIYRNDISCIGGGHSGDDHLLKPPSADVHLLEPPTISASLHNDTLCDNNGEANTSHIHTNGINHMDPQQSFRPVEHEGFGSYLWSELSRGYVPDENEAVYNVKKERVYAFLRIPKECEKFMFYGMLQCVDSFLFIFTFLPLRLMIILFKCLAKPWTLLMPQWYLSSSQKCDVVKGVIIGLGCFLLTQVDASMVYHMIRGQAIIKLYIFFNLLEVGDRLLSSFGQDILDALMWTIADSKKQRYITIAVHMFTGVIYVFLHSTLVLLQASALNVAFNSHNKALLTILISNNAVELKGSVFKKFEKTNLFQMACSDVRERFHFQVLIFIVILRNMTDFNWDIAKFWELVPDIVALTLSEMVVDETKHAFITKFNNIPSKVYKEYTALLANDVITSRKKNAFSDVSDQVSRRLGLIPLPLACLVIKIVFQCIKLQTPLAWFNAGLAFLCLLGAKMVIGVVVYGWAVDYYNSYHRDYYQEQAKKGRQRHKSGIDADLLKCENNYHWNKKPLIQTPTEVNTENLKPSRS